MELAGFPPRNGCFLPLIVEDHPQPPGCIEQGQRLRAQAAATADTAAERGPTVGGGFSSLRTQATTEQSSGLAELQSRLFPRVPE